MKKHYFAPIGAILAIIIALTIFGAGLRNLDSGGGEAQRAQLEESIRRAAVACYAAEGRYPPDMDYLARHYGLRPDYDRYAVFYEIHGENLMPEITVVNLE